MGIDVGWSFDYDMGIDPLGTRDYLCFYMIRALLIGLSIGFSIGASFASEKPNILFIAVDDLRPELGAYGATHIKSPNIDKLAEQGVLFTKAYTSVPTCGASRASLFTSVRPTPTRFKTHLAVAEEDVPWAVTMNEQFKNNGYRTISIGKIFHTITDSVDGWSKKPWRSKAPNHTLTKLKKGERGPSTEITDVPDDTYKDGQIATKAIEELKALAKTPDQPFFLAVGFMKPHLPFTAPQKYWDLYPLESVKLPANYFISKNAPQEANYGWGELRNYSDIPKKGPITDDKARHLIRGYYACVSYTDAQVGKVLNELDRLGLKENTIIILWGDHGWNLGDHTYWCKHTMYESSLHIPLIVRAPGYPTGTQTKTITETIDIFPTLCDLTNTPIPNTVEGKSFKARLKDPTVSEAKTAYSRIGKGDSIRTDRYRYSEYSRKGKHLSSMLYDHNKDPLETTNIANDPENTGQIKKLSKLLKAPMESTRKK
jgi:iduronate 2-sulfatase